MLIDESESEMKKSSANSTGLDEDHNSMAADVMRWLYCEQNPSQELRFGYLLADDVKRRLLTFWNSVSFSVTYANIAGFDPAVPGGELRPLDRWLVSRTSAFVSEATASYERYWTPGVVDAFERFVDDLSNWYIRRTRRRFWDGDETALRVLWDALRTSLQVIAPVMPFLAEDLWRNLVSKDESVFLNPWPEAAEIDEALNAEVAAVRQVVELGRQARAASRLKLRQPLRRVVVAGADGAQSHVDEIAEELRVKEGEFGDVEASELHVKPNLPLLGPKLGAALRDVREAPGHGEFEQLDDGRFRVGEYELDPDEVLVEQTGKEGWAVASADGVTVALEATLDPELELEAPVLDLIHLINAMRKEQGLELTDRIRIKLPDAQSDLLRYEDRIKQETLAVEIVTDGASAEPQIEKV